MQINIIFIEEQFFVEEAYEICESRYILHDS